MDIHATWASLMGANAGEIMSFTTNLVKQYWRLCEEPVDNNELNAYRKNAMSGDYHHLISCSSDFITKHVGVDLPLDYILKDLHDDPEM